jgi:hypothetical protein
MNGTLLHIVFDAVAWVAAGLSLVWLTRFARVPFPPAPTRDLPYLAALIFGAGTGAVLFGTLNLWISHLPGIARSVEGGLVGAIIAVEIYKRRAGVRVRTGARFALPLAVGVAVGRIGCFFAGLDDFTYGTPTALPWGRDFGDGIMRHPVQLYESASMAAFALLYVWCARRAGERSERPARQLLEAQRAGKRSEQPRSLHHRQRLLSRGRLVWRAAFRLGVLQTLWNVRRPVHAVSPAVGGPGRLCRRDDRNRTNAAAAGRPQAR